MVIYSLYFWLAGESEWEDINTHTHHHPHTHTHTHWQGKLTAPCQCAGKPARWQPLIRNGKCSSKMDERREVAGFFFFLFEFGLGVSSPCGTSHLLRDSKHVKLDNSYLPWNHTNKKYTSYIYLYIKLCSFSICGWWKNVEKNVCLNCKYRDQWNKHEVLKQLKHIRKNLLLRYKYNIY